jgi:hypothetical protein
MLVSCSDLLLMHLNKSGFEGRVEQRVLSPLRILRLIFQRATAAQGREMDPPELSATCCRVRDSLECGGYVKQCDIPRPGLHEKQRV